MICSHSSDRPFFIRFANVSDAGFDAKLNIIAFRPSLETVRCGIGPIPFVIEPPVIVPVGGLSMLERQCISMAEGAIKLVLFVCAVVAVGLTLLIILHRVGCIDVPAACGYSREQQRFDSLRENPYATQIAQELATPANPDEEQTNSLQRKSSRKNSLKKQTEFCVGRRSFATRCKRVANADCQTSAGRCSIIRLGSCPP
jgi:hypothetical protein